MHRALRPGIAQRKGRNGKTGCPCEAASYTLSLLQFRLNARPVSEPAMQPSLRLHGCAGSPIPHVPQPRHDQCLLLSSLRARQVDVVRLLGPALLLRGSSCEARLEHGWGDVLYIQYMEARRGLVVLCAPHPSFCAGMPPPCT